MSASPKGPAVWPEPAATSISIMVSRIASACSSISFIFESVIIGSKQRRKLLVRRRRVRCFDYCVAHHKPVGAGGRESARVLQRDAAVDLQGQVRITRAQTLY